MDSYGVVDFAGGLLSLPGLAFYLLVLLLGWVLFSFVSNKRFITISLVTALAFSMTCLMILNDWWFYVAK